MIPGEYSIQPGVSPRINSLIAGTAAPRPNPNVEIAAARNYEAAFDANPAAAKRLMRNRKLWIIVPSAVFIAFFLIVYFLP